MSSVSVLTAPARSTPSASGVYQAPVAMTHTPGGRSSGGPRSRVHRAGRRRLIRGHRTAAGKPSDCDGHDGTAVLGVTPEFLMNDDVAEPSIDVADEAVFRKYQSLDNGVKQQLQEILSAHQAAVAVMGRERMPTSGRSHRR